MSSATVPFSSALAGPGITVLDGGLSNQLAAAGCELGDALWSARALAEAPEAVVAAHRAYYEAGASVAITASYQATFEGSRRTASATPGPPNSWP
ncbi:homocysteine S-methyltransferase family protein [Streptomyces sp. KL116D]|uniref:homocysteine S-methyltransferase family protein n=1 Tax=Streptomyces sp. KL116D TaxID=3045152 RepID=UPI0035592CDC